MLGDKIAEFRKLNNMTQSDLGEALNISPQAVSKWERNLSQPDFDTINKMATLFKVPISKFSENDDENFEQDVKEGDKKIACSKCGKFFEEQDIFSSEPEPICVKCNNELIKEKEDIDNLINKNNIKAKKQSKNLFKSSFIWAGLITIAVDLVIIFSLIGEFTFGEIFGFVSINTILTYCFSNQMFYDNFLRDFIDWFKYRSFGLPGIIFGLDFGGILLFLLWKVIAPVIVFMFSICVFLFGCLLGYIISPFTFANSIIKYKKDLKLKLKEDIL